MPFLANLNLTIYGGIMKDQPGISRRNALKTATAAAGAMATPYFFVKAHAASDPKVLRLYNFDGTLGDFYTEHWYNPFQEKFDLKLEFIRLKGSRVPLEKVQAQIGAGQPETDLFPLHPDQLIFAKRNNLAMEIPRSAIPEYDNVYDEFITDYGPCLVLWSYGLAYNTEAVSPAPTSWKALWDPAYAGRVALNEALKDQTLQMVNLAFKGQLYPVDDATFSHLTDIRPNLVALWSSGADAEQLFRNDEIVMTPFWNGRVTKLKSEGLPLEFVVPDEGFFVRCSVYGIPRNARNPEVAMEWLNFVCGHDPQKRMVEFGYGTPNKMVEHTPEQAKAVIVADPEVVKKAVAEDFTRILDNNAAWTDMWNKWKAS
ncbi:MAG: extracellular solute-binding protein [Albidovulum sp.]|nr:extracellular solute-binding protein [Albidovulum sp.]